MAKEVSVNSIPDKHADWGIDTRNGLPYSGQAVQNYIKKELEGKAGIFYYDNSNNRYLVFSDSENKDIYLSDPTKTDLIIATFDAPFNYSAEINLTTPSYNAIFVGDTGNYIDFTFDIKNKQGASTGESVIIKYTFIRGASKQEVSEIRPFGASVHFNIDKYIDEGTNTIIVAITGQTTLAATTVAITYEVVNLQLEDSLDISKIYNLTNGTEVLNVPYTISGYGTKIVEWYIDGKQLDYIKAEDEIVEYSTTRTKHIVLSNLSQGKHSLQFRAYTTVAGIRYYTSTLYRDIIIYTGISNDIIIATALNIPSQYGILGVEEDATIYDMVQYAPYSLRFATYTATNAAETEVSVTLGKDTVAKVLSSNGVENKITIYPSESGMGTVLITAGDTKYSLTANIAPTSMDIGEITNGLVLNLTASGKSNNSSDKDTWVFGDYIGTLTGFAWNNTSGWVNNRLEMSAGTSVDINYQPLSNTPTNLGKTIEIEWATKNVSNDNAIICDLRTNGVGLVIYATKVAMISADGVVIETAYKSDENVRVSFVINPSSGAIHQRMSFIYTNGILSRAEKWAITDSYTSTSNIRFTASEEAEISLKSIRIYDFALSADNILNNYILYRDSIQEMLDVYDRNDIYETGKDIFDANKMASRLPVMIVTGDIPTLENTSDKDTQITVDIEYINLQDPSRSFRMANAAMRPQGTSSMGYPKKNFRIYTQKLDETILYDASGNIVDDKLYSFKSGAQPVNCWCLKADYAESSGTHNTGIARLWNKALYDARVSIDLGKGNPHNVDNQPLLRTKAQIAAAESGYPYDVRTTIDGFPILLFYRPSATDDLIFIGKYNFNNDKSTESVFGFKGIPNFDNSRMQCWEVLNNGNALALFTTINNFDTEWSNAFESRYPDTKTPNTADLKAFARWMVNVSTEDFVTEKWEHFDVYKMAAYWVYLMRHAAADQFVKNAMFTSEDGEHFYYILYDNDTINGLINTGHLNIRPTDDRYTIDNSGEPVFAGRNSRLWNMLEADDEFMRIVSQVDNALYSAGISYANTIRIFDEEQADKWVEKVYNQDAMYKYVSPYTDKGINNLFMLQGKRDLHRRWWLANRFAIYDAKYVSGEYKSQAIELKCINNTPSGQQFIVTSGYPIDYGFGINNLPREYGVSLDVGESHTFTTSEVVNLGDPIRIYGAPNIAELDLSPMASRLATITIANVYNEAKGTKLTKLVVGNAEADNNEVAEISGLRQASALEYLDVQGMRNMTSIDLTSQLYFKTLKAHNTNISSVQLAKGAPVSRLELPSSMRVLSFEQLPLLDSDNIVLENLANISIITIKDCPNVSNDFNFIYNWVMANSYRIGNLTLTMNRVDWSGVSGTQLSEIARVGNISITGKVKLTDITVEQGELFTSVWGDTIYDETAEFFIDAPVTVTVRGEESVLEGNSTTFSASVFPSVNGHFEWSLPVQVTGVSIDRETGVLTTTERSVDNYDVVVRATFIFDNGDAPVSGDKSVEIVRRTYPEGTSIIGNGELTENTSFTWIHDNEEAVNGEYYIAWSLIGPVAIYYEVAESNNDWCTLRKTSTIPDTTSGTLQIEVRRRIDDVVVDSAQMSVRHTVVWMKDATIIGSTNPLEQPMEYTWETTTQGVNGDYYAEWLLEGDVTSVVKIKTQTNDKCTLEVLNAVTEVVQGTITLKLRKQYDNSVIVTTTKTLAAVMEGVVITSASNAPLQSSLYDAGLVANETYSLKEEIEKITIDDLLPPASSATNRSVLKKGIASLDEFRYFTSVTYLPNYLFYNISTALNSIIIPNSVEEIRGEVFSYCSKLTSITIPDSVTSIGNDAFAWCDGLTIATIGNGVNSIGNGAFKGCRKLKSIICKSAQAPSVGYDVFGYADSSYTGRDTYSTGENKLYIPINATGYNARDWLDPLQNPTKCGFTIYGKLTINANSPSAKFAITYTTVDGETKTLNVNSGASYLNDVQYDTNMTIRVIEGGIPAEGVEKTFVYNDTNNTHTFTFPIKGSWITIDQTITDPSTMISGDVNGEHIQAIRNNSHRYLGKYTATNTVTICQLSDEDSSYYHDGATSMHTSEEGDVFIRLPKFWYTANESRPNVWDIGFFYGEDKPEDGWVEWSGDTLLGVYSGGQTKDSKLRSVQGKAVNANYQYSFTGVTSHAKARGTGFCLMTMEWFNMLTMLFYAKYGTTNFASHFSSAATGAAYTTGATKTAGMIDKSTGSSSSNTTNFWGIEGLVFAFRYEYIGNVDVDFSNPNHLWNITESDGSIRTVKASVGTSSTTYVNKLYLGNKLDVIPSEAGTSSTTGYCIKVSRSASSNRVLRVNLGSEMLINVPNNNSVGLGRLCFYGNIVEEENSSVYKSLTAIQ